MKRIVRIVVLAALFAAPVSAQQSAGSTGILYDPKGDVETWSGLVLPVAPQWETTPAAPVDLYRFGAAFFIDGVTWHGSVKDLVAAGWGTLGWPRCPPDEGDAYYWVDTHFSYGGRDFRLHWTNEHCAQTTSNLSGMRTLWIDGELVGPVDSLGGAAHIYAEHLDKDYLTWHNESVIEGLYITSLARDSKEPCDMNRIGSNCGRHWRDRQPDVGVYPDLAFNGTPRFVPKDPAFEATDYSIAGPPIWPLLAVAWLGRRKH